ncbi:hypothetical protein MIND_01114100 [Mycena indigotica]|uniref:Integrase core domain-containing protein n=1 Tax=Mycena indigotica TaxID=2126181 RepID=A0A8H6VX47_9AGAR|nr:uncharacterized protein MIND_01114100 [Mycena indigotica]KAF7293373.1 hypothetical protein MIND_01114100 [Mycena indigotica]
MTVDDHPELPQHIQKCIDENVKQADIPAELLREHNIKIGLRSVERIIDRFQLKTTRHSGLSELQKTTAVLTVTEEDPLGRWGARKVKEKLAMQGIHMSRPAITTVRKAADPDANDKRRPDARTVHKSGIFCSGPNEEWCMDGHEKILDCMGIGIYGTIDKYGRYELQLNAMRSVRRADIPPALYLRLVKEKGGIPIQTTTDMGSETGILAALQTTLRQAAFEALPLDQLPAHRSVKSVYNITRERNWRPLWEKDLANIKFQYESGKIGAGYHPQDPVHQEIAVFVWGMAVQRRLDEYKRENALHRVRKQKNVLLPTGGRHKDFYEHPERWGGKDQLIPVDMAIVNKLIEEHTPPDLYQFTSNAAMEALCQALYSAVQQPEVSSRNAWAVFTAMVNALPQVV